MSTLENTSCYTIFRDWFKRISALNKSFPDGCNCTEKALSKLNQQKEVTDNSHSCWCPLAFALVLQGHAHNTPAVAIELEHPAGSTSAALPLLENTIWIGFCT